MEPNTSTHTYPYLKIARPDGQDQWAPMNQVIEMMKCYLERNNAVSPDSHPTSRDVAEYIDGLLAVHQSSGPQEGKQVEVSLRNIWELFLSIAKLIPYDHPAQAKLILVLKELSMYRDLDTFNDVLHTYNLGKPTHLIHSSDSRGMRDMYINRHSFLARLVGLAEHNEQLDTYLSALGIACVRDALEKFHPLDIENWVCYVQAASQWVLHAGAALYAMCFLPDEECYAYIQSVAPGAMFTAELESRHRSEGMEKGMTLDRWKYWRSQFQEIVERRDRLASLEGDMEALGKAAEQAVSKMEEVERETAAQACYCSSSEGSSCLSCFISVWNTKRRGG
ncbi:hypothetical protein QBC46DRAFT_413716 [Diplogelasinospora grovesii]|uniref:Uncharacterized protein n=1 Tax=Diplogelasinospora grovesii TaxID=303347 RepID=A0AAN6MYP1_9PEZI|nr:hypothetical protein QBC46DRAFT_413716 [Diplogelasinospora grovesii]